jgi:CheY-like chemotaxis protein
LALWIRGDDVVAKTKIIFLTATNISEGVFDRGQLGIDDQLLKPVKEQDLVDSIASVLCLIEPVTTSHGTRPVDENSSQRALRILLAEDNLVNQKLAVTLLQKAGHSVVVASNGQEAIDKFIQSEFDVVLMDVQMPEVDGFEATFQIRKLQTQAQHRVPIIALTAHASAADRKRCLAAGMDEYISKPFRSAELYELIESQTGYRSKIETASGGQAEAKAVRLVDWAHAFETVGGDHQLLHELIKVFLKDRDSLVDNIRNALESDNDKELRLSAHSIKGALTHLGARESAELAMKMESLASKQDINSARSVFEKFASSLEPLTAELKEFVSGK